MEEADDLSENLAIIDHGKIIADGKPSELKKKIGTGDVIEFRVPEDQLNNRNQIVETIKNSNGAYWVKSLGKELISINAKDGLRNIAHYYDLVETHFNFKMQDVQIRQNSLEDVFIELTGRQLRD